LATGIDSPRAVVKDVLEPTYNAMGLEGRGALRRAARESWDLPDGSVLQIGEESPEDLSGEAIPYVMASDGHLTRLNSAREQGAL
jgi:hypothetical protein